MVIVQMMFTESLLKYNMVCGKIEHIAENYSTMQNTLGENDN